MDISHDKWAAGRGSALVVGHLGWKEGPGPDPGCTGFRLKCTCDICKLVSSKKD